MIPIIFGFIRSKNYSSFNLNGNQRGSARIRCYEKEATRELGLRDIIATCRFYSLPQRNERENGKYRGIGYEEDKERETVNARESRLFYVTLLRVLCLPA